MDPVIDNMFGDLHIHMILDGVYYRAAIDAHRQQPADNLIRVRLADYQARGIRFLRDGGDAWGVSLQAKALAAQYGIDYRSPAFPIHLQGHYGGFIGRGFSTWQELSALLRQIRQQGGDFVKLMISGLIDFSRPDALTEASPPADSIHRMVAMAHDAGFAVMVHANGDDSVNAALDEKAESVEHGAFLHEETLLRLAQSSAVWVPTLSTVGDLIGSGRYPDEVLRPLLARQQEKAAFVAAHGGLVGLGSDAGAYRVCHGQAALDEYAYLQAALGTQTDAILTRAEETIRRVFKT